MKIALGFGLVAMLASATLAHSGDAVAVKVPAKGSVTREEGLAAWSRVYTVVSHPRCSNCHVGKDNIPRWSGLGYGPNRVHGMNIHADESRIGGEALLCSTCHVTSNAPNVLPHAPPHVGLPWHLAPVEFEWFGKSSPEICAQVREPARNGGRSAKGLSEHLAGDPNHGGFIQWAWNPGGGREPAPGTLQGAVNDVLAWGAAGMPCPGR